jgi:hypothetical protein
VSGPRARPRAWTEHELAYAVVLRQRDGLGFPEIADRLEGRTAAAVARQLSVLGRHLITGRAWLPPAAGEQVGPRSSVYDGEQALALAQAQLAAEIAAARREAPRTPLYRGGWP